MNAFFAGLFFVGVLAAVRVMLYGVERERPAGDQSPRSFSASPALIAAFGLVAGAVGYTTTRMHFQVLSVWIAAIGVGLVATYVASKVIAAWWTVVPEHDIDDERYVLQGSLGRVVRPIAGQVAGEISLESSGHTKTIAARALDHQAMPTGTEVVIERIEDGVAYVEDWETVEKRL